MENNEKKETNLVEAKTDWLFVGSWIAFVVGIIDGGWLIPLIGAIIGYVSMSKGGKGKIPMIANAALAILIFVLASVFYNMIYYW